MFTFRVSGKTLPYAAIPRGVVSVSGTGVTLPDTSRLNVVVPVRPEIVSEITPVVSGVGVIWGSGSIVGMFGVTSVLVVGIDGVSGTVGIGGVTSGLNVGMSGTVGTVGVTSGLVVGIDGVSGSSGVVGVVGVGGVTSELAAGGVGGVTSWLSDGVAGGMSELAG